jgi:hypothetical protein
MYNKLKEILTESGIVKNSEEECKESKENIKLIVSSAVSLQMKLKALET